VIPITILKRRYAKLLAYRKKYYKLNKERLNNYQKQYYEKNKENYHKYYIKNRKNRLVYQMKLYNKKCKKAKK